MHPDDPTAPASPTADDHPDRIGSYRILSVLGEGGMGVVYLAAQTEPVRRDVALKILKLGMDTRQIVARFEAERQALAVMEHPGIAKVYDAGATSAGRPYFVMERVEGVPITEYCDAHRLGVHDRVRLVAQVCRAVQHAHQKGVIHRDLKPSNVLVTVSDDAPLCKIIDFGIAKAIEQRVEDGTRLTQVDQTLGTPAYMSPEQVHSAGQDIDTRSDIYSIGVLLYELLAGVLPFEPQAYHGWALRAQHLIGEPRAPGARYAGLGADVQAAIAERRRLDPAALRRQLRGELDWVVMRALEQDRERRYETANGMARDLDRFLANEPVAASPPSRAYQVRKFVRRHRAGVAFAAVLAMLLLGFAGAMGVQAGRVSRARDLAVVRQGQAEDLIGFMLGDLRDKLTPVGRLDILDDVGQRALAYFAAVPESELSDEELFRRAEAIRQLGEVRLDQGTLDAAMEAFREALALTQQLAARDPLNSEWQLGLGNAHFWVGEVLRRQGDLDGALAEFEAYRDLAQRLVQRDSTNLGWQQELAYGYTNVGAVAYARRDLVRAVDALSRVADVQRRLIASDTANRELQFELSDRLNFLGAALEESGDLAGARVQLLADVALKRALLEEEPEHTRWLSRLGASLSYVAANSNVLGMPDSALAYYREELAHVTALVERDAANAAWRRNLAVSSARVGLGLMERGDLAAAAPLIERGLTLTTELVATNPAQRSWRVELGNRRRDVAVLALAQGRTRASLSAASRSIAAIDSVLVETPDSRSVQRNLALSYLERGRAWQSAGRSDSAHADWTRAAALLEEQAVDSREWLVLDPYARTLLHLGRHDDAGRIIARLQNMGYRDRSFLQFIDAQRGHPARTTR